MAHHHQTLWSNRKRGNRSDKLGEEEWQNVHRRRRQPKPSFKNNFPNSTSYYINNIPEGVSNHKLWTLFEKSGDIVDAFVARKKDKGGNYFGFVRFNNVTNPDKLVSMIQNTKCEGAILGAYLAKFDREGNPVKASPTHRQPLLKKPPPTSNPYRRPPPPTSNPHHRPPPSNFNTKKSSFKEILTEKVNTQLAITLPPKEYVPVSWLACTIIAKTKNLDTLNSISSIFSSNLSPSSFKITYVSGLNILLTFPEPEKASEFMENNKDKFPEWFSRINFWNKSDTTSERIAILKIFGHPISLRCKEVSNIIGKSFGEVIESSKASYQDGNLQSDKVTILTGMTKIVNSTINLRWQSQPFQVVVSEEFSDWSPEIFAGGQQLTNESEMETQNSPLPTSSPATMPKSHNEKSKVILKKRRCNNSLDSPTSPICQNILPGPHNLYQPVPPLFFSSSHGNNLHGKTLHENGDSLITHRATSPNPTHIKKFPMHAENPQIFTSTAIYPTSARTSHKRMRTKSPTLKTQPVYPISFNLNFPPTSILPPPPPPPPSNAPPPPPPSPSNAPPPPPPSSPLIPILSQKPN